MTAERAPGNPAAEPGDGYHIEEQLLEHAQAISALRRDLDTLANDLADTLAAFSEHLDDLQTGAANSPPALGTAQVQAWCWKSLGPEGQKALLAELGDWVGWLRRRYPLARKIPPCWPQHPELVEELTALWLAWQAAYTGPDPPLTGAADFHDRWLPGLLHRLEHGPHATDCTAGHHPRPDSAYADR